MALSFTLAGDFDAVADFLETVTVTDLDGTSVTGCDALPRQLTKSELEIYGQLLHGSQGLVWNVSVSDYPNAIYPGHTIAAATGTSGTWRVLAAQLLSDRDRHRCVCVRNVTNS